MFLILWTWAHYVQPASSQGKSSYQRWPRPHSWPQMWRLKVSWVPMATMRTTLSTPHCCVSLSVVSALLLLPLWRSYLSTLVSSFSSFLPFLFPCVLQLPYHLFTFAVWRLSCKLKYDCNGSVVGVYELTLLYIIFIILEGSALGTKIDQQCFFLLPLISVSTRKWKSANVWAPQSTSK